MWNFIFAKSLTGSKSLTDLLRPARPGTKRSARARTRITNLATARNTVQVLVSLVLLYTGFQFYLFVTHFETGGRTPFAARPPLVEGFLPISGLVSVKHLLVNGIFDSIHPAGLVIFLTILAVSLLFKKAFCSWFCPIGTLFEWTWKIGRRVLGTNISLPKILDYPLMAIKYLILAFFIKAIVLDMDGTAIAAFVHSPYNMIVDVKMLYFFTKMSTGVAVSLLALLALSAVVKNFWCRYLCPYGALLGLISFLSPITVTRNASLCTDCRACTRVCPNRIDVARATSVASPECSACLTCVDACPRRGALELRVLGERAISGWAFAALLVAFPAVMLILARVTGHWETSLTYADWAQLIPLAEGVAHP